MEIISIIITIFSIFALSRVIIRFRKGEVKLYEFLFWSAIWCGALLVVLFPGFISSAQKLVGLVPNNGLLSVLAMVILFYLVFRLYVRIEKQDQTITKLVREVAIKKEIKKRK